MSDEKKEDVITVVTSNNGKYKEYKKKLGSFADVEMKNIDYDEIQTNSLEEVVKSSLKTLKEHAPLMIDDSGLFIDTLGGFPGVYSAYVMDTLGCDGILKLMGDEEVRSARFECVIGYLDEDIRLFKGVSKGEITSEKRGEGGFGYDPIFRPDGRVKTYAEMSTSEKNDISHRGRAMDDLIEYFSSLKK